MDLERRWLRVGTENHINELRLNFIDPAAHAALKEKMREFLFQFE